MSAESSDRSESADRSTPPGTTPGCAGHRLGQPLGLGVDLRLGAVAQDHQLQRGPRLGPDRAVRAVSIVVLAPAGCGERRRVARLDAFAPSDRDGFLTTARGRTGPALSRVAATARDACRCRWVRWRGLAVRASARHGRGRRPGPARGRRRRCRRRRGRPRRAARRARRGGRSGRAGRAGGRAPWRGPASLAASSTAEPKPPVRQPSSTVSTNAALLDRLAAPSPGRAA